LFNIKKWANVRGALLNTCLQKFSRKLHHILQYLWDAKANNGCSHDTCISKMKKKSFLEIHSFYRLRLASSQRKTVRL